MKSDLFSTTCVLIVTDERIIYSSQTPVLNDVRDITLARQGLVALISYENKVHISIYVFESHQLSNRTSYQAPPQLWKLELVKDRENNLISTARLTLRHTYMPKAPVDFAGPSYFGGKNDELVLCAGKGETPHKISLVIQ